jgi:hypothetical protein
MSQPVSPQGGVPRPKRLLTQNRELKAIGVWNWSLPAWAGRLPDGRTYNTCPSAGICAQVCYARNGSFLWPVVRNRHQQNLMFVLDDLPGWEQAMTAELGAARFRGGWIRIHDAGDFFSDDYLAAWLRICRRRPDVHLYCYTKEISRFRRLVEPDCCATPKITTGAAFTMPTKISANRTAGSVSVAHHRQGAWNARSFTVHNGPIALRLGVREDRRHLWITAQFPGAESLSVEDRGRYRSGRYTEPS